MQLSRHLIGHQGPIAKAPQQVWSLGLNRPHCLNVRRCHLFESRRSATTIKLVRLKHVKGLVWLKTACQFQTIETTTIPISMQKEEWSLGPTSLHRDYPSRRVALFSRADLLFLKKHIRQVLYCRPSIEGRERQFLATSLLAAR